MLHFLTLLRVKFHVRQVSNMGVPKRSEIDVAGEFSTLHKRYPAAASGCPFAASLWRIPVLFNIVWNRTPVDDTHVASYRPQFSLLAVEGNAMYIAIMYQVSEHISRNYEVQSRRPGP
jgi:hypothetical protein